MKKPSDSGRFRLGAISILAGAAPFLLVLLFSFYAFMGAANQPGAGGEVLIALTVLSYLLALLLNVVGSAFIFSSGFAMHSYGRRLLAFASLIVFLPPFFVLL